MIQRKLSCAVSPVVTNSQSLLAYFRETEAELVKEGSSGSRNSVAVVHEAEKQEQHPDKQHRASWATVG